MKKYRVPVEAFDDLVTQMNCPVINHQVESEREGTIKKRTAGGAEVDVPVIKKYVTFEFVNQSDEDTWKKLKGIE